MANIAISAMSAADALAGDELVEVSQLSSIVTITATTISALASDNSYNDSGSGFVSAGFAIGDRVNVAGFTGNTANNIFAGVITDLTAGKMTIGGTDGDVIVNDSAGESVTISKWETRRTTVDDIAARAGASTTLDDLSDTNIYEPADGDVLVWDDSAGAWVNGPAGGSFREVPVFNFTDDGEARFYADVAMTLTEQDTSGTGTVAYEKSTTAAPDTFSATSSPITLEAGAWLKVTASSVSSIFAVALKRTA